jgi:cytochrome c oxidase subunit II
LRLLVGASLLIALAATGCGTGGYTSGGDVSRGATLFSKKCASCHTLAAAGAKGKYPGAPNLDDAFSADRQQGIPQSTILQVVHEQIQYPSGAMPANLVKGADAEAVAAFVSKCASRKQDCSGLVSGPPPGSGPGGKLYASLGCQGCHSVDGSPGTGPTFKGLFGSTVKLANGKTIKADMAYLIESIVDPDKQIVQGYKPGIMSASIKPHSVSMANAKALADFIKKLK